MDVDAVAVGPGFAASRVVHQIYCNRDYVGPHAVDVDRVQEFELIVS